METPHIYVYFYEGKKIKNLSKIRKKMTYVSVRFIP